MSIKDTTINARVNLMTFEGNGDQIVHVPQYNVPYENVKGIAIKIKGSKGGVCH